MSKMVNRIVLLLSVMALALACGGTPTPELVHPTPDYISAFRLGVKLEGGEAIQILCEGGLVSTWVGRNEVTIYCVKSY